MNPIQIVAGVVAGAVGAAIWAAISYYGNVEIGYVAWGIGILVGVAVAATGKNTALAGVAAVLITIVSLLAGKYAAIELAMQNDFGSVEDAIAELKTDTSDQDFIVHLADQIVFLREDQGQEINWPEGMSFEDAYEQADYPADIWNEADGKWQSSSPDERESIRQEYYTLTEANMRANWDAFGNQVREQGFMASFSPFDLLFFGLAVFTAWGIASREEA